MRYVVLSSVGAQDMDTSGYQVFDMGEIEFQWQHPKMNSHAIFPASIDITFPLQVLAVFICVQMLKTDF